MCLCKIRWVTFSNIQLKIHTRIPNINPERIANENLFRTTEIAKIQIKKSNVYFKPEDNDRNKSGNMKKRKYIGHEIKN